MLRFAHRFLLFLLLSTVAQTVASQTEYRLHNHDHLHIQNCHGDNITIQHPNNYVTRPFEASVTLETNGVPFNVSVSLNHGRTSNYTTLRIWDGDSISGTLLVDTVSGSFSQFIQVTSGYLTVSLERADSSLMEFIFTILWFGNANFSSTCVNDVQNIQVSNLTHNSATLQRTSTTPYNQVSYGDVVHLINSNNVPLQDLTPNSHYTVSILPLSDVSRPCCARTASFVTDCLPYIGIPDFTEIYSASVRGYYGTFTSPYDSIGLVDYPDDPFLCRHTIHTDTTETDPRTGNLLRTVCPGTRRSVRLGNWNTGAEAEALEYTLYIDTNYYALLLLHYAVVLQNPDHSMSVQPHFRMEVLDNNGDLIDPVCGAADFAASSSLGWHEYVYNDEPLVWKDWTTEGFDMTPYHGQVIRVRFITKDCAAGLHYGYAYFNAECRLNRATTEYCGETDTNTITAPDGFNYLWYFDLAHPVSTEQTIHFSNNDSLLHCRLISKTNPACWVTLNTYAGHRWPVAIIDTLKTESLGCDGYRVYFLNRSVITKENGDTVEHYCETARWYFGDSFMSFDYAPQHVYRDSGDYTVTLISGIANNSCTDTTRFTLHIPDFYIPALKDTTVCDTMWFDDVPYTTNGPGPSYRVHHNDDCDTVYTLNATILHSPLTEVPPDTFCYSTTYLWRGLTAGHPDITDTAHYRLVYPIPVDGRCDSLVVINLTQLPPDHLAIRTEPDCSKKRYTLTAISDLPYLHWSSTPHDPSLDGHETDSILLVSPVGSVIYTLTSDYRDSVYCPTVRDVVLHAADFPEARLTVNPAILTYDNPEFDAHDISGYNSRRWALQTFPGSGDTLYLAESSPHLHYRIEDFDIDSIKVILSVNQDYCEDTTHLTLPFVRSSIWAPNAFTPSEDANNRFAPISSGLLASELYIYDRAGRIMFSTQDLGQGWDGTHNGQPCPQGTYVWLLRYQAADFPAIWQTQSGTVTLLR